MSKNENTLSYFKRETIRYNVYRQAKMRYPYHTVKNANAFFVWKSKLVHDVITTIIDSSALIDSVTIK